MKFVLHLIAIVCPAILLAQPYTTTSQGSNNGAGRAYVAPVITKTYSTPENGYKAPASTPSYSTYKYSTTTSSATSEQTSSDDQLAAIRSRTNVGIYNENGKYGVSDMFGYRMTDPIFKEAVVFHWKKNVSKNIYEPWYIKVREGSKWGIYYFNSKTPAIPVVYDEIQKIDEYTVMVKLNGKCGFLELSGSDANKVVIPVEYDDIGSMSDKYLSNIWLRKGNKYGLISAVYKKLLPVEYQEISPGPLGYTLLKKDNKYGLVKSGGSLVLPVEYDNISENLFASMVWVQKNNKWGLLNFSGEMVAEPQYDSIYIQPNGDIWYNEMALVLKDGKKVYLDKRGEEKSLEKKDIVRTMKMEEHFDAIGTQFNWPKCANAVVKNGQYEYTSNAMVAGYKTIPFPDEISFKSNEDWILELKVHKTGTRDIRTGIQIYDAWGVNNNFDFISYINKKKNKPWIYGSIAINGAQSSSKFFQDKVGGYNRMKLIRKGTEIKAYINDEVIANFKLETKYVLGGKFYLLIYDPAVGDEAAVAEFDDIHFEILEKK